MCSDLVNTDFQRRMQCKMWTLVVVASEYQLLTIGPGRENKKKHP